jgi:hypothetical protein
VIEKGPGEIVMVLDQVDRKAVNLDHEDRTPFFPGPHPNAHSPVHDMDITIPKLKIRILGNDADHFLPHISQDLRQGSGNVGQTARFDEWRQFRCDEEYFHLGRLSVSMR